MKPRGDIFEHTGIGFSTMTMLLGGARTKEDRVDTTALPKYQLHHFVIDRIERCHVKQSATDTGLVGCDHNSVPILVKARNRFHSAVDGPPFARRLDKLIAIVIDHAIAVENYQLGLRIHSF